MVGRVPERVWRTTAIVLCAAVPASFYLIGDLTDAFPGVLTISSEQEGPEAGPRAQAEDWDRVPAAAPGPDVAPEVDPTSSADLEERMSAHAGDPVVDDGLAFSVVDVETGEVIAARDADAARVPASTLKLLTAAAVLRLYTGDEVLTTRATVEDGLITLQGGGDMTLTDADLRDLATQAAQLATDQGTEEVSLALDTSYLSGGANPAWGSNGTAGGWVTPTATLALDEGWLDGEQYGPKSTDPEGDVARRFVELLEEQGLTVTGKVTSADAPTEAPSVEVHSAPLSEIVQHTLLISDNTTAELLAHLVAAARGDETTTEGAAAAVEAEVRDLATEAGVPAEDLEALTIRDGSGLSTEDRVPPALFSAVLAQASSPEEPVLQQILFDVPIAGLSGTLADRFGDQDVSDARGLVRGKTGYLGGSSTLAGTVVLADGRTAGFSIVVHGFDGADADAARAAVDDVAAEMVRGS
ncbi:MULTISPECIES: D-alanyl-D-alanine carboxypeptidase/D-alanyl-D-alanine-endopeptidase [Brachybacterium]|uniref:D-alanyl-D-alanine carboxypeptidase n=1 Tax=Brachybacterium alimentarium TaxID=47845 RepID=A0A2A3YKJ6_9MICO|nr:MULTISPECIES: D-alanyl-D-alanine carboxypeptidase [Brachybacterium]PCC31539.1 D-alanyl-D-alanine carboxypeptidase [Brachybacterium alimentarium]PCC39625.1 D-alanyl-D-alanine carboxypeptidase [Brachybacterium alimentarium]RCS65104.1 D-alanyl-D-alanine carboxypeptidase [Brachybacterium sp. JB7]RCS69719.1 D-alanyl-D-alanine carboxypeptidase [Brachybacterium alimentarium]RCS76565.1 D-alanyl-D-alanine carboxypeptidase [Brachybacterium alimentarium]